MHTVVAHHPSPTPAPFRHAGESSDPYRIWIDGAVLRIDGRGAWDMAIARAYVADITRAVTEFRRQRPLLRAIVDRSVLLTYADGVREVLLSAYQDILRDGDRIAMVVGSSLVKGQVRLLAGREETQSFLSISAARTWVLAYG